MDDFSNLALIILICPLVGFVIQVFFGSHLPRQGDWVPTFFMFIPLCIATWMVVRLLGGEHGLEEAVVYLPTWGEGWLFSGDALRIDFAVRVDNLTIVMLFVVTLVSFLVHLYSWGYMHGEVRYGRFFAYLGLFSFSMLGLCISDNLLFLFIFWELVGLCSYFLIGFYFEKKSAQEASIKAFMTTRIGDLGFFAAILIIGATVGSLRFDDIFESVRQGAAGPWTQELLVFSGLLLICGPIGKSAQFPLHVWLPDAMEGPTPVSALIHAATMVAAGVYLVGRMFPFLAGFQYFGDADFVSSTPLLVVALVGGFTAIFAATIAFGQTDIKKVLAYSTISQLGYMFLGLGVGSLSAGLFHLMTHAFFKALLFLGSGSVIHAVHSNEMSDMGGLRKKLPITHATFLIGTLAIAGLPFLSGFYSKEMVLTQAYAYMEHHQHGDYAVLYALPFWFGIITAGMTCFYMFRMFFLTFWGKPKNEHAFEHAHESPWTMTVPLCILALLAVAAGGNQFIGDSHHWFEHRVNAEHLVATGAGAESVAATIEEAFHHAHGTVMGMSIGSFVIGLILAALFFLPPIAKIDAGKVMGLPLLRQIHGGVRNLWFVDQVLVGFALGVLHRVRRACGAFDSGVVDGFVNLWATICAFVTAVVGTVDYGGVDGAVRGIGKTALEGGRWVRRMQTGFLQVYLYASIFLFAGLVLFSIFLVWRQLG